MIGIGGLFRNGLLAAIATIATTALSAEEIPAASPEEVGMSSERLLEIDAVMQRHIDSGEIQGAVTVVARRGKVVHFKVPGLMDVERGRAMQEDAIFRMASSSKPVLGVAAMMMIEERLLHPSDEVGTYLPQFKDMHFFLPPAKESRRVVIHGLDAKAKGWDEPSRYVSASGGLASTARDFLRFEQMLANGGTLLGKRLLSPRSVATMSSNQVGELFQSKGKQSGWGVGYGVAVVLDPTAAKSARGQGPSAGAGRSAPRPGPTRRRRSRPC